MKNLLQEKQLKELVMQHFNLVDSVPSKATFGEIYDENKAFKIIFPGDTLKVGDEVKVETAEGQQSLAPDGLHKLEDGTTIKTEGSSIVEIISAEGKSEEEMAAVDGLGAVEDKEIAAVEEAFAGPKEDISNVEGTSPQNATTVTDATVSTLTGPVETEADIELKKQEMKDMKEEMKSMKDEMKAMKDKFEEIMKSPATEKTMAAKAKTEKFTTTSTNDAQIKVMRELMKNKNK